MNKSCIAVGQMFAYHSKPFPHSDTENETQVWVKVTDDGQRSMFVNNNALAKISINPNYKLTTSDKWSISDEYYGRMVQNGEFVPLDDLNEVEGITLELGWPDYVIDF
jgi:hypothetical protein